MRQHWLNMHKDGRKRVEIVLFTIITWWISKFLGTSSIYSFQNFTAIALKGQMFEISLLSKTLHDYLMLLQKEKKQFQDWWNSLVGALRIYFSPISVIQLFLYLDFPPIRYASECLTFKIFPCIFNVKYQNRTGKCLVKCYIYIELVIGMQQNLYC